MYNKLNQLLFYRDVLEDPVIGEFRKYLTAKESFHKIEHLFTMQYHIINHRLIKTKSWKELILELVLLTENIFTLSSERKENIDEEFLSLVAYDIAALRKLYNYPWDKDLEELEIKRDTLFSMDNGKYYHLMDLHSLFGNENIGDKFVVKEIIKYINEKGTGFFSMYNVFKWDVNKNALIEIKNYHQNTFDDLIGYEIQIKALKENTIHFIEERKGNNVLLYGQRGTGKSSLIKALVPEFASKGLRVIEIKKRELDKLPQIIKQIENRNYSFIIFIDDLSFEEFETDYKHFKAMMEGSFEKIPENTLFYVTSNRRHLVRETFKEREEDIHKNESSQEKLSLFDRFGLTILYDQPKDELYNEMVLELAKRHGVNLSEEELLKKANEWKVTKSVKSGRAAQQLIDSLRN